MAGFPQQILRIIYPRKHQGPTNCLDDDYQSGQENSTTRVHLAIQKQCRVERDQQ